MKREELQGSKPVRLRSHMPRVSASRRSVGYLMNCRERQRLTKPQQSLHAYLLMPSSMGSSTTGH